MARVFTDGAEFADLLFFNQISGTIAASSAVARSGVYSYRLTSSGYGQRNISAVSEGYWRFSFYFSASQYSKIFVWYNGTTELGSIRINNILNKLEAYTSTGTLVATGSLSLNPSVQYLIEVHVKIADAGDIEVRIEGGPALDIDFAGDTKPGAQTTIDGIRYTQAQSTSVIYYFDDLAMNDTTGGVDDSWCGDEYIILLKPNAAGDVTQLTPTSGSANWSMVDEIPHDVDTTYVESSGSGDYDLYNLTDCGLSNVVIRRVIPEGRVRNTLAEGGLVSLGLKTDGTEDWGPDQTLLTSYRRFIGSEYTVNPVTDEPWTVEELDALQVGTKVRS